MNTNITHALDAIETIFHSMNWTCERQANPNGVFTGCKLDWENNAHIVIMPDDLGTSLLLGCAYHFTVPKGQLGKIRRFLQKETLEINGLAIQFDPKRGVRVSGRCWLPQFDLSQEDLTSLITPYFRHLMFTCTQFLYPALIKLLRHHERIKPQDDFHLPS